MIDMIMRFLRHPFGETIDVSSLESERYGLRQKREDERRLMRLARNEFMDTLTKGVLDEVKGKRH